MAIRDLLFTALACAAIGCGACGGDDDDDDNDDLDGDAAAGLQLLDPGVCAPGAGPFSLDIDNEFFPLPVGHKLTLEGDDDGTLVQVVITVLDETEDVAGVTTRVVEESESEDGELVEVSRNFFVQAPDGTVCYYGEDVDDYDGGEIVGHAGQWRAGEGDNAPGIIMPGSPAVNTKFAQESAPGIAEDMSAIIEIGVSVTVPAGTYDGSLHAIDWNPLEGGSPGTAEDKYYAPGVGLIVDDVIELTSAE